jgi:hypothetical protein
LAVTVPVAHCDAVLRQPYLIAERTNCDELAIDLYLLSTGVSVDVDP